MEEGPRCGPSFQLVEEVPLGLLRQKAFAPASVGLRAALRAVGLCTRLRAQRAFCPPLADKTHSLRAKAQNTRKDFGHTAPERCAACFWHVHAAPKTDLKFIFGRPPENSARLFRQTECAAMRRTVFMCFSYTASKTSRTNRRTSGRGCFAGGSCYTARDICPGGI